MYEEIKRNGTLIGLKFREYFLTTLITIGSASIAAIVDRMMVGNLLNSNALAACNLTGPIAYPINIIVSFFVMGGSTMAMTYKGRCDSKTADKFFSITILIGTIVMTVFALICFAFCPVITDLAVIGHQELYQPVHDYFIPQFFQGILILLTAGTNVYMTVDGMRKRVIIASISTHVVNITCDYLFMGVFHWGIMSAGFATITGYAVGFILVLPYFTSRTRSVHFIRLGLKDLKYIWEAVRAGMAPALSHLSLLVSTVAINYVVLKSFGGSGMQILAVCTSGLMLASIFYFGFRQTILPIGGALYGEKDFNGLKSLVGTGVKFSLLISAIALVLFEMFPVQFAWLFDVKDSALMPALVPAFRLFVICIPFQSLMYILQSFYQSTGHQKVANTLTVLDGIVFFVPILFGLSYLNKDMIWLVYAFTSSLAIVVVLIFLQIRARRKGRENFLLLEKEKEAKVFDFSVPNTVDKAVQAAEGIQRLCDENGVDPSKANILALAAEELCTNTAKYSYGKKSEVIDVFLKIYQDSLMLKVRDNGNIFNPTEYITPEGVEVSGLKTLQNLPADILYNRVLGFNTTIVTTGLTAVNSNDGSDQTLDLY